MNPSTNSQSPNQKISPEKLRLMSGFIGGIIFIGIGIFIWIGQPSSDPEEIEIYGWLFPIFGVISILINLSLFKYVKKRQQDIERLKMTGHRISGVIYGIEQIDKVSYRIVAIGTDTAGNSSKYYSGTIQGKGQIEAVPDLDKQQIPVNIYIDLTNPKKYYVDISNVSLAPRQMN